MATHNLSPTQSVIKKTVLVAETVVATCLLLAISAIIFAVFVQAGQLMDCKAVPPNEDGTDGRWIYRFVEGRTCWFEANGLRRGREKPLEELRWPALVEIFDCPSSAFRARWNGEDRQ